MRESNNGNNSPVLMSHRVSIQSDYQLKQPLLCSACERRFSVNGESYVVPLLKKGNRFPLLDKLKLAVPLYCTQTNAAFVCQSVGLVGEKIGYFGLSILWRAAARTWQMFDRATTSVVLGSNHLESLRKYIAGEAAFPGDSIAVIATVATDFLSQNSCFVPSRVTDNPGTVYSLLIRGLHFRLVFGDPVGRSVRGRAVALAAVLLEQVLALGKLGRGFGGELAQHHLDLVDGLGRCRRRALLRFSLTAGHSRRGEHDGYGGP